jgi:hypothetical protein
MSVTLNLTESNIFTAVRAYLLTVLPAGMEVVDGQDNRVPEPAGTDFVTMTPILRERLETNVDAYQDVAFTASIDGDTMTVTDVSVGSIAVGAQLLGNNLAANSVVTAFGTGTGGDGTYTVSPAQNVASQVIAAGTSTLLQPVTVTIQLDVHGPCSADNTQIITTTWRDQYAVDQLALANSGYDLAPLYHSEPRQMPFENGEQQIEERWTFDLVLQANPIVTVPLQFASQLEANLVDVSATYPPT